MANKKHFYFPDFGNATLAIEAWWAYQNEHNMKRTTFNISATGRKTDVYVSDECLAHLPKIIVFFRKNYSGRFAVKNTQQGHAWSEGG
ncbi:MAG: hypothetical protein ABII97_02220 [Patescibacteria group bacterium]